MKAKPGGEIQIGFRVVNFVNTPEETKGMEEPMRGVVCEVERGESNRERDGEGKSVSAPWRMA